MAARPYEEKVEGGIFFNNNNNNKESLKFLHSKLPTIFLSAILAFTK
jgi:hypothetical protein